MFVALISEWDIVQGMFVCHCVGLLYFRTVSTYLKGLLEVKNERSSMCSQISAGNTSTGQNQFE